MSSDRPYRPSGGRLALGIVLAVLMGAASPLLTVLEVSLLMPVIVLSGVFMVFLYFYAGRLPAWIFMTVQLCAAAALLNGAFMAMLAVAGVAPAMLTVRGLMERRPFFGQLRQSVLFYGLGLLAALAVALAAYGGGMIERAADAISGYMEALPDAYFQPLVEAVNAALGGGSVTVDAYRAQMTGILALAKQTYAVALPGMLLSGAALSGVLSVLWGSWLMARRGMATDESYIPLTRWFLPASALGGLMLMWLAAFILMQTGYAAGESVHAAALDLLSLALSIQALAAIDRFFYRRGVQDRGRRARVIAAALLALVFPLAGDLLFLIGLGSATFGSHGAIKNRVKRDNDEDND